MHPAGIGVGSGLHHVVLGSLRFIILGILLLVLILTLSSRGLVSTSALSIDLCAILGFFGSATTSVLLSVVSLALVAALRLLARIVAGLTLVDHLMFY